MHLNQPTAIMYLHVVCLRCHSSDFSRQTLPKIQNSRKKTINHTLHRHIFLFLYRAKPCHFKI